MIHAWREGDLYLYQLDSSPLTKVDGDDNRILQHGDAHQGVAGRSAGPSSTSVSGVVMADPLPAVRAVPSPDASVLSRSAQLTLEVV